MYRNARDEPVDGASIGKVLHKLNQYVYQKDVHNFEEAHKAACNAQKQYNKVLTELSLRKSKLAWLHEEQKKLKFDSGRQESLKNAADLKAKINTTAWDLNIALKERKRLKRVTKVCLRNLAKNEEWINCLEKEIKNCGDMITYLLNKIHLFDAITAQREMDQKTRDELFKERQKAITEFVHAMQDKTSALVEPNVIPESPLEKTKSISRGITELENEFSSRDDSSPRQKSHSIITLKGQELNAAQELIEKTAALKMIASIAGVDDYSKTSEIVKFFKQTEDLRKIKAEMEQRLERLKTELEHQRQTLKVMFCSVKRCEPY